MTAYNKEYATVLSTDMTKAFDSLHFALMIQKLKAYGSSEASQNLMRSFLKRKGNRVKLGKRTAHGKNKKGLFTRLFLRVWNLLQNDLSLHR